MAEGRVSRRHLPKTATGERQVRTVVYNLRMAEGERHQLRMMAAAAEPPVTVSRLLIDSVLYAGVKPGERAALYAQFNRVAGELGKVGANVNQLAYWANAHQAPAPGMSEALGEVRRLVGDLRAAAEAIAGVK